MKRLLVISLVACGGPRPPTPTTLPPTEPAPAMTAQARIMPAPPPKPVGHPSTTLIPRAVLFGAPERARVRLSPDGKQISWLAPVKGVLNVWVAPVDKLDAAKPVTSEATRPISDYFWTYTNKQLLYLQDTAGDENFHVFRVDLADAKTTDLTPYPKARAMVVKLSEKQPATLIVAINDRKPEAFDLYRLDLLSGKRTLVVQNDANLAEYTIGDDLAVRLATRKIADGGNELLVPDPNDKSAERRTRSSAEGDAKVDDKSAERRTRSSAEGDAKVDDKSGWRTFDKIPFEDSETSNVVGVAPNGKAVYATDSRGRDTGAFVSIDLTTKKVAVIAEDPKADAGDVLIHPTKHTVQAVAFTYDRLHWKVIDPAIQKDLDNLGKLDGGEVHVGSRSLDDKTWIVATTSEKHPGRYYLWDRAKQNAKFLFALQPELEKQPLVKMHPVIIRSSDGLDLVSYLSLPLAADADEDGTPEKPVPMVLLVHGGPWARDSWGYNALHQLFANRGYAVLSVNYRGSTGLGKTFLNAANLEWGKAMHQDLIDATQWAIDHQIAPRDKIAIAGGSYGGYATLVGLAMTPDVFACGVDIVGPSNLMTLLASIPAYWTPIVALFKKRMGDFDTEEGKALLTAASPLTHASHIRRPLLIGQGANDPRVKQAESEQIVAAMKRHHLAVTYVVFPDEGHGFQRPENNMAFFAITEAFLSAHLGGEYLPLAPEELKASSMQVRDGRDGIPGL